MRSLVERLSVVCAVVTMACGSALAGSPAPVTTVPEPATMGLIATGIVGVAVVRRLRRRK